MRFRLASAWCAGSTTTICSCRRSTSSSPSASSGPRRNATSRAPVRRPATGSTAYLLWRISLQVRQMRGDERTQGWKDSNIGGRKRPDRQIAGASSGGLLRQTSRMIEASEDVFRLAQEHATGVGQRHVMAAPIEKRDANCRFELADLLA